MKFARFNKSVVNEVVARTDQDALTAGMHPDLVATFKAVADDVENGWIDHPGGLISPTTIAEYHIDETGLKNVSPGVGLQVLDCAWNDQLSFENDSWRIKITADYLADAKAGAKRRVIAFADRITDTIMSTYPRAEVASWAEQANQARRVVDGGELLGADELLTKLAGKSGDTVAVYAVNVLAKAASFEAITVEVKGLRDQSEAAIDAVTDITGIEPLLSTLKTQAEAVAVTMGLKLA